MNRLILVEVYSRVESGLDDPDYLGHLGHFLKGQVGLICTLSYLNVTRIAITCSLDNSVGIW